MLIRQLLLKMEYISISLPNMK